MDKSAFDYHGSGIPVGLRNFFHSETLGPGDYLKLLLQYGNKEYNAKITRESSKMSRTRIFWDKELSEVLKNRYPEYYESVQQKKIEGNKPKMFFESIDENKYLITLSSVKQFKTMKEYEGEIDKAIQKSKADNSLKRKERLKAAASKPASLIVKTTVYKRNPDVIAEVLKRANGFCEKCGSKAPFIRASDNSPYLEVHHVTPLAEGGEDTVENAIGVCPNCHRELHFGLSFRS